jgi:uncharacterized protein YdaU (DUF1376 family)
VQKSHCEAILNGFLHRNCEGTEQLRKIIKLRAKIMEEDARSTNAQGYEMHRSKSDNMTESIARKKAGPKPRLSLLD